MKKYRINHQYTANLPILTPSDAAERLSSKLWRFYVANVIRVTPHFMLYRFDQIDMDGAILDDVNGCTDADIRYDITQAATWLRGELKSMGYRVGKITVYHDDPPASYKEIVRDQYNGDEKKVPFSKGVYDYNNGWTLIAEIYF